MKNLSEKFDKYPQDFDKEAIWQGVHRPVSKPYTLVYALTGVLVVTSIILFFIFNRNDVVISSAEEPLNISTSMLTESEDVLKSDGENPNLKVISESAQEVQKMIKKRESAKTVSRKDISSSGDRSSELARDMNRIEKKEEDLNKSEWSKKFNDEEALQLYVPDFAGENKNNIGTAPDPLPYLFSTLEITSNKGVIVSDKMIRQKQKKRRGSLVIRGSLGFHLAKFTSSEDEETRWRSDLEKPQLDYGLGLRYEYRFKNNFLLSVSAGYYLYKDKINTTYIRDGIIQDVQVDYKLHNHYHVFAGQVEAGKRFQQKEFFWDINAGLGVKFWQSTEADYFVGEGMPASQSQVEQEYHRSVDPYFTGETAIGRNLDQRTFIRMGAEFNSAFDLTGSDAGIRHRITPFSAFVEFGLRL